MTIELKVPPAGESITEVIVAEWLKPEGAHANQDEAIALIETDKANIEIVAPASGTLARILKKAGDAAKVGEVIGLLEPGAATSEAGGAQTVARVTERAPEPKPAARTTPPQPAPAKAPPPAPASAAAPQPAPAQPPRNDGRISPSKRRALRAAPHRPERIEAPPSEQDDARPEETVPMTPLRRRVAERLLEAQHTQALLTTFNEIDMSAVIELRTTLQESFKAKHGIKLGFMSFFVKASIEALRAYPGINAEIRGTDIVYRRYFDIGVAVGGGKGLVVPVIRNAERLGFAEIEQAVGDFAERARESKLKIEELQGGTFTISNGGIYGSLMSTPIINPPQSGILGMHVIQERPVVKNGAIAIAPMMYIALTYDHRLVDGREAVGFLVRIKECVENPNRILLEV